MDRDVDLGRFSGREWDAAFRSAGHSWDRSRHGLSPALPDSHQPIEFCWSHARIL